MSESSVVELTSLDKEVYGRVVCYPHYDEASFAERMSELSQLGIDGLRFGGTTRVNGVPILGKGCVGIVLIGYRKREAVAVKILRTDANRINVAHEAQMLKFANAVDVGPSFVGNSEKILITRYVEGPVIPRWIDQCQPQDLDAVKRILRQILDCCFRMDQIGLDHGELSRADRHVIIENDESATILDFESASVTRKVTNLTSICQYLFLSTDLGGKIRRLLQTESKKDIIKRLTAYKHRSNLDAFDSVTLVCGLGGALPVNPTTINTGDATK